MFYMPRLLTTEVFLDEHVLPLRELGEDDLCMKVRVQRVSPVANCDPPMTLAATRLCVGVCVCVCVCVYVCACMCVLHTVHM